MLLARLARQYPSSSIAIRRLHSIPPPKQRRVRFIPLVAGATLGGVAFATVDRTAVKSEDPARAEVPLSDLIRAYAVYTICGIPAVVDHAPTILSTVLDTPVIGQIAAFVVRHTFFAQVSLSNISCDDFIMYFYSLSEEILLRKPSRCSNVFVRKTLALY